MTTYLLNSPRLTDYGTYEFRGPMTPAEARSRLPAACVSAIGHAGTAQLLAMLLERPVPVNRVMIRMEPGDDALVLTLLERAPEGAVHSLEDLGRTPYEIGWLTRMT